MKTVLKSTKKTKKYLEGLPKYYLIGYWASFGILEFPFSGKYITLNGIDYPLVWQYNDSNGENERWCLVPIYQTTTGLILTWTQNEKTAQKIVNAFKAEVAWKNAQLPQNIKE